MEYIPLAAIRAFDATARHLSFSRAGDELHVTHAAISHQIRRLETWLGVSLFVRGRRVRLTESGVALFAATGNALRDIDTACRRIRGSRGTRIVTVGCIPSIASRWLVPRLNAFAALHPRISLKVMYASANEKLADGDNDVLVTLGNDSSPLVQGVPLFSRASRPVCSPAYLARRPDVHGISTLAGADLLHDENHNGWRAWFRAAGIAPARDDRGPVFADFNILATAVIAGHGVALCPAEVFREEIARGDLVVLSEIATDLDKAYFMTMAKDPPDAVSVFADWFRAEVAPAAGRA